MINKIINDKELKHREKLMKYLPKINELCNFMINFSISIWKNLIIILDVKIKHGNYLITSIPLFWI